VIHRCFTKLRGRDHKLARAASGLPSVVLMR